MRHAKAVRFSLFGQVLSVWHVRSGGGWESAHCSEWTTEKRMRRVQAEKSRLDPARWMVGNADGGCRVPVRDGQALKRPGL